MGSHACDKPLTWATYPKIPLFIFSVVLLILIQRFSTCYLSLLSESKESILKTKPRNNSLHELAYVAHTHSSHALKFCLIVYITLYI